MTPKLTPELQEAVENQNGGPVRVQGKGGSFILLSIDRYRSLLGDKSDEEETAEAVAGIQAGLDAVKQGRTRPLSEALDDLGRKYET